MVIEKLSSDVSQFVRPSATSYVCFVFNETIITEGIILAVKKAILQSSKEFTKIAFCGVWRKEQKIFKKEFSNHGFAMGFLLDLKMRNSGCCHKDKFRFFVEIKRDGKSGFSPLQLPVDKVPCKSGGDATVVFVSLYTAG